MARASTTAKRYAWLRTAVAAVVVPVALAAAARAQTAPAMPPATVEDALQEMSAAAGVIFTGEVTAIRRIPGEGGASGVVEIDFRIDKAVRGCVTGSTYKLLEWAGLWTDSNGRYRIGQRLLMMLRAPGASGMSSPVGGMDGAIPIRGVESEITAPNSPSTTGATVNATDFTTAISASAPTTASPPAEMVDLRWVGTRTLKSAPGTATVTTVSSASVSESSPAATGNTSIAAQGASVDTVLGMLSAWEQARAGQ